jgi:hypothetical protein
VAVDLPLAEHFVLLIATFRHASAGGRVAFPPERWESWRKSVTPDQGAAASDDAEFFLPYARGLLFPAADQVRGDAVARLVARPDVVAATSAVTLEPRHGEPPTPLTVSRLEALAFPTGLGFLVVKLRLTAEAPGLEALSRANQQLRVLRAPSRTWKLARLAVGDEKVEVREWLESALGGLGELVDADRLQLVTFACVDRVALEAQSPGPFASPAERVLYELGAVLRAGATLDDPTWVPGHDQIEDIRRSNAFQPWQAWRLLAFRETLTFLATEALPFTTRAFPRIIEGAYVPLYVYALHQQLMLARFADELVARVAEGKWDLAAIRRHTEAFVDFRHRYWFAEVTRKPLGSDLYRRFQNALGVGASYELASRAVADVRAFYEERRARQITLLLQSMTFVFGPFGVSMGIAGLILPDNVPRWERGLVVLGLVGLAWLALLVLWMRTRARDPRA